MQRNNFRLLKSIELGASRQPVSSNIVVEDDPIADLQLLVQKLKYFVARVASWTPKNGLVFDRTLIGSWRLE